MSIRAVGPIESRADYPDTPTDQYNYWDTEIKSAQDRLKTCHKQGTRIVRTFLGGTKATRDAGSPDERGGNFRLNLFHSNVLTLQSMLYGNLPKAVVSRRHDDPNDDVGRVAAMILERLLNNDIQDNGKEYNSVLRACLQDRLLPGLGCARLRYTVDTEPDADGVEQLLGEDAPVDYYHWRDVLWGWSRTFSGLPWIAFRSYMRKDSVIERFGEEIGNAIELKREGVVGDKQEEEQTDGEDSAWNKAEIWEVWDKERRQLVWYSPGLDKILDTKPDPLGLSGFFPCPPMLLANQTTSLYIPTSDYSLAQDLYNEIDVLQTRISVITEAVKVVGVYDRTAEGLSRMFKEGTDNDLIPVDNWALFAEKGGIQGQIDWVPMQEISETLLRLRELRDESIGLLQQVTGMSDIMRGELGGQYEGVGQSELKAKFGSVRVQALQDEFAAFASDILQLKAEIIGLHFDPQTIAQFSNIDETFDMELVPSAIELIKNPVEARLRVEVRPESIAMVDYAQLKQERMEYITALATYLQSASPLIEAEPTAKPYLLELLKWGLSGFKGSNAIEGVLDKAIEASNKEQGEQPDKDAEKEKAKSQAQMQLEQLKHKNALELIQAKSQADAQLRTIDLQADIKTSQAEMQSEMQTINANLMSELAGIKAKLVADMRTEIIQAQMNAQVNAAQQQGEMQKDMLNAAIEVKKAQAETKLAIKEAKETANAKAKLDTGPGNGKTDTKK